MDYKRVAQIHTQLDKKGKGGTGYLIRNDLILTAYHVIALPEGKSQAVHEIRFIGDINAGKFEWRSANLCWHDSKSDLALLKVIGDKPSFLTDLTENESNIQFGKLGGATLPAQGYGFPEAHKFNNRPNAYPLEGKLNKIGGIISDRLSLQVTSLMPYSPEEWGGISGTALFIEQYLVGVITETSNNGFRQQVLWVTPISRVASDEEFCKLVLDNPNGKIILQDLERVKLEKPFQAPPLPIYYVDRPEYSQDLKTRLLTDSSDVRTLVVTAIHGLGSVGKSTIAAALAHDPEVQDHFGDGILWATLGQQPNLLSLLNVWVQELSGDYKFQGTTVEAISNRLRTLLHNKAVLLVVDDAWNPEDAQAFNVGGARCQVLVTTRNAAIADVLGASTYSLDVMTPEQAMELLTKKLGRLITGEERQSASDLAKAVGYLPLALELVAAEVASGTTWTQLLEDFQLEVARLKTLDRPEAEEITDEAILKRFSLRASLNLSVKRIPTKKQQHFSWLGVLPEDVTITKMMAATLWNMDVRDTAKTLQYLQNKALLLSGVPLPDSTPTYRLHDLFHDLARNLLTAPPNPEDEGDLPGLGITLPAAHATFLEKYQNKTSKNLWHTLPSDGYIHQHLVWHLEKAGKIEKIHELLREDSETGGNGWYEACDRLGQTANFVTDVARAWQLAEKEWTEASPPQVIGLQCRYALIIASLNSLSDLPVKLLLALIQKNVWTPEQGLAYVLQSSNPKDKAYLLTKLADHLPPNLKELALLKALAAAREIQDEYRFYALSRLADRLPELFPEALVAAREIQDESDRVKALSSLADKLPNLLPEILVTARDISDKLQRAYALRSLADKLPPELFPEVLATFTDMEYDDTRAKALISLAPILPPNLLPQALAAAGKIRWRVSYNYLISVLNAFANKLPDNLLPEALAAVREIQSEEGRAYALSSLAVKLPDNLLPEALAAAREIQSDYYRAYALSSLAVKLPDNLLPEALAAAREIQSDYYRAYALSSLAVKLPDNLLPEALAVAREIQDHDYYRAIALSGFADKLPDNLLPEALAAAREIQHEGYRAYALIGLNDKLPANFLPEALAAARKIEYSEHRAEILSRLIGRLLPDFLQEALAVTREIPEQYRANALSRLADKLPDNLLPKALAVAMEIQFEQERAYVLGLLADKLPANLLLKALAAAREIQSKEHRAYVLCLLADRLPELLQEALAATMEIQDERYRADTLSSLSDRLPPYLLQEALVAARKIQDERYRADALSRLADRLPELFPEALVAARKIQSESDRADALSRLADKLPPDLLPEVLAAAREIQNKSDRADALSRLADRLPELFPEALVAARKIQNESYRADALSRLADKLPDNLFPEALAATMEIQDERHRADALSNLAPILPPELLPEVLAAAREIQDEEHCANALSSLALILPPELLPDVLVAAREIQNEEHCAHVLSSFPDKPLTDLLPEVSPTAREIQYEIYSAKVLISFISSFYKLLPYSSTSNTKAEFEIYRADTLNSLADKPNELLQEALTAAKEIQSEKHLAEALSIMASKLQELLPDILAAARKIQNESHRADVLTDVLSSLVDKLPPDLLLEALTAVREIQNEGYRANTLISLANKRQELLPEALAGAGKIWSELKRAYVLSSLADKLPANLLPEALAAAREIQSGEGRAYALSSLADKLPANLLPEALAAAREIQSGEHRVYALSSLADKLLQVQKTQLFEHWRDTLHVLSVYTRPNLLSDLNALTPVIFTLGDQLAVKDTADAIQDVSRWWS